MARDAMTNDEFKAAAQVLAETGDMRQVIRAHPHIDPVFFVKNGDALHKAAGITPPKQAEQAPAPTPAPKPDDPKGKK